MGKHDLKVVQDAPAITKTGVDATYSHRPFLARPGAFSAPFRRLPGASPEDIAPGALLKLRPASAVTSFRALLRNESYTCKTEVIGNRGMLI